MAKPRNKACCHRIGYNLFAEQSAPVTQEKPAGMTLAMEMLFDFVGNLRRIRAFTENLQKFSFLIEQVDAG